MKAVCGSSVAFTLHSNRGIAAIKSKGIAEDHETKRIKANTGKERDIMKKQMMTTLLGLMVIAGAYKAQAQVVTIVKAQIPFSFYLRDQLFPCGEYTLRIKDSQMGLMEITSNDGKATAFFLTYHKLETNEPAFSELVFNKYGDREFLSQVQMRGYQEEAVLRKTKLEKALENGEADVEQVAIALR